MRKNRKKHRMSVLHSHEFSPMARATVTLSKAGRRRKADRRQKQRGWQ